MNLVEIVQEVVPGFRTAETKIHVHTPTAVVLSADPERLRQALENLLAHAIT
jgi:signal transduction histidine kinase